MSSAQIVLALVPVAIAVVAVIVAALAEPWRARRNQSARGGPGRRP